MSSRTTITGNDDCPYPQVGGLLLVTREYTLTDLVEKRLATLIIEKISPGIHDSKAMESAKYARIQIFTKLNRKVHLIYMPTKPEEDYNRIYIIDAISNHEYKVYCSALADNDEFIIHPTWLSHDCMVLSTKFIGDWSALIRNDEGTISHELIIYEVEG